jgi:OFA family oxalate/formate antiporter-like MFS transporter
MDFRRNDGFGDWEWRLFPLFFLPWTHLFRQRPSSSAPDHRWVYAIVGIALMSMFGLIYAWSVFVLPLEREFGWSREQTSLTFAITMTFFSVGVIFGGALTDRKGPRAVCFIAGILTGGGLLSASFTASLTQLYLSYGLVCGLAVGIAYSGVLATVVRWFPDYRGAVSGILMMGFGFGGLLLGFGANHLIETLGWRAAFRILGGLAFVVIVVFSSLLRPYETVSANETSPDADAAPHSECLWHSPRQVLREPSFWMLWFWHLSILSGGLATVGHIVPLAIEEGFRGDQATYAMGILSILNGIGRIGFGVLSDRFGKRMLLVDSIFMTAAMLLIASGLFQESYPGLLLFVVLAGFAFGGAMPQGSANVGALFGSKYFGTNFGLLSTGLVVAALFGPYLSGFFRTATGSYSFGFLFLAGVAGLGLIAGIKVAGVNNTSPGPRQSRL